MKFHQNTNLNFTKHLLSNKVTVLLFFITSSFLNPILAQETSKTFIQVKLKDKSKFIGELISKSKDSLIIRNKYNIITGLHRDEIKYSYKVQPGEFKNGKYYPDIVSADKGYLAPAGFGPKKGEVYFENTMLVWNELNAGLTDHISLRVGFDTYTFIDKVRGDNYYYYYDDEYEPLIFVATKFELPILEEAWHIGLTTAVVNVPDNEGFFDYGFAFLSNTWGNRNKNLTVGYGAHLFGEGGPFEITFITLAASVRLGRGVSLITENWLVREHNNSGFINSLGLKIIGKKSNWSITFVRVEYDGFVPFPILSVAVPISRSWGS